MRTDNEIKESIINNQYTYFENKSKNRKYGEVYLIWDYKVLLVDNIRYKPPETKYRIIQEE